MNEYESALDAIAKSEYASAQSILRRCLEHAGSMSLRLRYLVDLGYTQRELALFNESIASLSQAHTLAKQVRGEQSLDVANVCIELARTLALAGEYREAERHSDTARSIVQTVPEEMRGNETIQRLRTAAADCTATVLRFQGRYASALRILRREMRELRHRSELAFEYALILNHCGMLCKYLRRFKAAHVCYHRALMFQELQVPTNSKSIADIYYNLGGLEHAANPSGKKSCGVVYARRALRQRIKLFGWSHPDTALAASMIAANLIRGNSYRRAEAYAKRAINIQQGLFGDTHRDIAVNLNHLGTIRYALADYQNARGFFERAYAMKVATVGDGHPDLLVVLCNLLRTKKKLGDGSNTAPLEAQLAQLCEAHPALVMDQFRELLAERRVALDLRSATEEFSRTR